MTKRKPIHLHKKDGPKFVVNEEDLTPEFLTEVERLAANLLTIEQIARLMNLTQQQFDSARARFPKLEQIIKTGRDSRDNLCTGKLFDKILAGDITAIIFYLKTQRRWKDETKIERIVEKELGGDPQSISKAYEQLNEEQRIETLEEIKKLHKS